MSEHHQQDGIWAVSALLRAMSEAISARFGLLSIEGELSAVTRAASGHWYFSLKDSEGADALVRCAMFRQRASSLAFVPAAGQRVVVKGRLDIYPARGDLQFIVEGMRPTGDGALMARFLALKAKLEAEGLFDTQKKRPLPTHPKGIAVICSLAAAALQDVLATLRRRAPHVPVRVYPALVQGVDAPISLMRALEQAQSDPAVDMILICRGGGSLEDLWAFNDEAWVRAVAASALPVVSGVGHETDYTLCDFVADLRAPTPTAAAELSAPQADALLADLRQWSNRADQTLQRLIAHQQQRIDHLSWRMGSTLYRWTHARTVLSSLEHRLLKAWSNQTQQRSRQLLAWQQRLQALNPASVLTRGFAWVEAGDGLPRTSVRDWQPGEDMSVILQDGRLQGKVEHIVRGMDD